MIKRLAVASALAASLGVVALVPTRSEAATPRQDPGQGCQVEVDKVASPARIRLGEQVQIRLTFKPTCPPAVYRAADIVLAIDRSRSMLSGNKLEAAKAAARTFVSVTDLTLHQVAIVGFHDDASLEQGLTQNAAVLNGAIAALSSNTGTNIADAIDIGAQELMANGRPDTLKAIILITDGSPNRPRLDPEGAAIRSANSAKLQGIEMFAIGLGNDVDESLLRALVTGSSNYYFAPNTDELEIVYRSIALLVGNYAVRDLVLDDTLTDEVAYASGSGVPAPTVAGATLRWTSSLVPTTGLSWVYTVTPTMVGTYPTNEIAVATYKATDSEPGRIEFPVPVITVLEPEPDPNACSLAHSWTVMVHSFPDSVGVSSAGRGCNNRFDSGDWYSGARYELPELEYKLTDASGKVLFEGIGLSGAGRVDQWLYIRVCEPPPYTLALVTNDLAGYTPCHNTPLERQITRRDFRPEVFRRTAERYGFVR